MSETIFTNLRPGDGRAYEALALAVQTTLLELVVPFRIAEDAVAFLEITRNQSFLEDFLNLADQSTNQCCCECAKIMRQSTVVPEVLGLPTALLAGEIRKEVFKPQDGLIECLRQFKSERENMKGKMEGIFSEDPEMYGRGFVLLQQSNEIIINSVSEYLARAQNVIEPLLDYCCARCFAAQVSLEQQRNAVTKAQNEVAQELDPVIKKLLALHEAKKSIREERLAAEKAQEMNKHKQFELEFQKRDPGLGAFSLLISVGLAFWSYRSCNAIGAGDDDGAILWLSILCCGAVVMFLFGLLKFSDRRPKS